MEEWNCIKSKVESIYNDNGTRTEKYISEYVFVGDKLVDSVKNGEINDEEASIRLLESNGSTAGYIPSSATCLDSTTVASRCAKVVAGEGSVRSSAGT